VGTLGDRFPEHEKQAYVDRHLRPGQVLYLYCDFTTPPKGKYVILACPDVRPRPLLFIINSLISPYIQRHPELLNCQVLLAALDHPFLAHDSYINCSNVVDYFDYSEIRAQLVNDVGRIRGELSPIATRDVIQVVRAARTISPHHKKLIVQSLK